MDRAARASSLTSLGKGKSQLLGWQTLTPMEESSFCAMRNVPENRAPGAVSNGHHF